MARLGVFDLQVLFSMVHLYVTSQEVVGYEAPFAGSPVTATVEIAEAKGSVFGSTKSGSGPNSGAREVKQPVSKSETTPLTPKSRPVSQSASRRSSGSGGKDGTGRSGQAYGAMKELPQPSPELATGITPLAGGEATGENSRRPLHLVMEREIACLQ